MIALLHLHENHVFVSRQILPLLWKPRPYHSSSQGDIPLLCRGLLMAATLQENTPVIITSTGRFSLPELQEYVMAELSDDNTGWFYFPSVDIFNACAMDAIRGHDPQQGDVTLRHCWEQVVLQGRSEYRS